MIKNSMAFILAITVLLCGDFTTSVSAKPGKDLRIIPVIVNGQKVRFPDTEPYINTDGRTMVPVRFVSEKLGAKVDWEPATETAVIRYGEKEIKMPVGSTTVAVNGESVELDTAAEKFEGRTMVPLRFVSEVMESKVDWDEGAHAVKVTDAKYQAKVDAGEVKLDPWGREYSKKQDEYWMRLTDLETTGFYNVHYKSSNRKFFETRLYDDLGKTYVDEWATHIRDYYAAQLNVDYRTIDAEKFAKTLIANMRGMSTYDRQGFYEWFLYYVEWVKKNKIIAKGYADPENSQVMGGSSETAEMRVYFKFMIISGEDTSQTFLDNWQVSRTSDSFKLKKGVWYGGYASVVLNTNIINARFSGFAVDHYENMFGKMSYQYKVLN
ncbi:copper amine oxidase N-terminal domain-containing protein [Cohnella sp. GCM10027633]|uniref:copper amine oxidase N-terminal domain-containing protein n=1 Tax=unclassified Cohnella TaxID=2636738 RepID=UPI00362F3100